MARLKNLSLLVLTEECLEEYFDNLNFAHVGCFKATLSKVLGFCIIAGSLLVKVPQIVKLLQSKSAEGINIFSVLMDLFAITATVSYSFISGFPFSSWGDGIFLSLQTLAIAVLIMYYSGNMIHATAFLAAYLSIIIAATSGLTPVEVLWFCQTMNIPIVLTSKLMQAYTNYSNGSTGQLSAITGFLLFFGSLARIFTSYQETGDVTMIVTYTCSTSANAVLALQILYYWNVDTKSKSKMKKVQ
ncbi:mannose-P-dolichol utilization defect 1 protein homolog [Xylocopa sonorina]|uniref:mannose-P-dolichol utilization defect 1 protein homolog n=1 Tax=Xylocopa sonorina TaxID=1818115 RepID=UPI00403AE9AC